MKRNYRDIDLGHAILSLCHEPGRNGPIITAFANNLSVRSATLIIPRVQKSFCSTVETMVGFPEDTDPKMRLDLKSTLLQYVQEVFALPEYANQD